MRARFQTCMSDSKVPDLSSLPHYITLNQHMSWQVLSLLICVECHILTKIWSYPVIKVCSGFLVSAWGHAQKPTESKILRYQRTLSQEATSAPTNSLIAGPKAEITQQGKRVKIFLKFTFKGLYNCLKTFLS